MERKDERRGSTRAGGRPPAHGRQLDDETPPGGGVPIDRVDDEMDEDPRDTPPAETVRRPRETGHGPRPPFSDSDMERGDEESGRPLKLDQDKKKAGRSGDQR